MANQLVLRDGGGAGFGDADEAAALEQADGALHGGFGEAGELAELLKAERYAALPGSVKFGPQHDVDEKCGWRAVVPGEVGEQDVEDVVIDGYMEHNYYTYY